MEYTQENKFFKDLNEHSSNFLKIDPDVCSWNNKKYPSLKLTEGYLQRGLSEKEEKMQERSIIKIKPQKLKLFAISPEINNININDIISRSSSKEHTKLKTTPKNINLKKYIKIPKKFEQYDIANYERSQSPNYENNSKVLNKSLTRRYKCRSVLKEKPCSKTNFFFQLKSEAPEKFAEIFNRIRSQSPDSRRQTPYIQNKLSIYTAKTLEELLANAKLPDISSKKSKLRSRYYNNMIIHNS